MHRRTMVKCGECLYWRPGETGEWGECHAHAPRPLATRDQTGANTEWPPTSEGDQCGEAQEADHHVFGGHRA